ncbi:MAG: hypothetical protein LIO85_09695 [Rikenellaceae bacterium]|nr:hypothetical protein [Rikenellaceae bacterium]
MEKKRYFDLIDDYLAYRLDDTTREEFERELAENRELRRQTEQTALLADAIIRRAETALFKESSATSLPDALGTSEGNIKMADPGVADLSTHGGFAGTYIGTVDGVEPGAATGPEPIETADDDLWKVVYLESGTPAVARRDMNELPARDKAPLPAGDVGSAATGTMPDDKDSPSPQNSIAGGHEYVQTARKVGGSDSQKGRGNLIAALSAAAVLTLLAWYGTGPKYAADRLYADFFDPSVYEPAPSRGWDGFPDGIPEELPELLSDAYFAGDYGEVVRLGADLLHKSWDDVPEDYLLMLGASLLETGRDAESREIAEYIIRQGTGLSDGTRYDSPTTGQDAEWLLVWIEIRRGDRSAAEQVLREIISHNGYYSGKAINLLSDLKARRWF